MLMKKKIIERYADERWKKLLRAFRAFGQNTKPEELHDFRVEIKKLRALFFFLESVDSKKIHKHSIKKLRTIFREAGTVRSLDVSLNLIKAFKLKLPATAKSKLQKKLKSATATFHEDHKKYGKQLQEIRHDLNKQIFSVSDQQSRKFFQEAIKDLDKTFRGPTDKIDWHESRKTIKILLYIATIKKEKQPDTKYLHDLQENIGQWHDTQMAMELLKAYAAKNHTTSGQLKAHATKQEKVLRTQSKDFAKKAWPPSTPR